MRSAVRCIAIMAVAFILVPTLFADDTATPAESPRTREYVNLTADSGAAAEPLPGGRTLFPLLGLFPGQGPAGTTSDNRGRRSSSQGSTTPKVELFVGYSFWRSIPQTLGNRIDFMHGGSTSLAVNLNSHVGLVFDFGGHRVDTLQFSSTGAGSTPTRVVDVDGHVLTFMFGPRFSFRSHERFTPFVQVLGGIAHASDVTVAGCTARVYACIPLLEETRFIGTAGGGLDLNLNHRIALRLFQVEYLLSRFRNIAVNTGETGWQNNLRLSTGLVFRFGGNPPPPPPNGMPMASCSVDPRMVYAGSGNMAAVHAAASDPDNDPLTYSWEATGGTVEGTGPDARWNSTGTAPGSYSIRVRVDDARGGTADCSAAIQVDAPPNRPPTITCSANPSSLFAGERSRIMCNAVDADGDTLTYAWRANNGRITGNGPTGDYDTTGLSPGSYSITTRVDDGGGGAADASTSVEVRAVPPAPMASKINECMFGSPLSARIDNVCKRILDDVALRLQSEPRSNVVIIGYSDPGERRPAQVSGDRASNAVKYLGEKGIDASRATTRTGSGQAGAGDQNRRVDVIWVPEGATY